MFLAEGGATGVRVHVYFAHTKRGLEWASEEARPAGLEGVWPAGLGLFWPGWLPSFAYKFLPSFLVRVYFKF
ncbi:unnamed protein product [Urochloa humidicola]